MRGPRAVWGVVTVALLCAPAVGLAGHALTQAEWCAENPASVLCGPPSTLWIWFAVAASMYLVPALLAGVAWWRRSPRGLDVAAACATVLAVALLASGLLTLSAPEWAVGSLGVALALREARRLGASERRARWIAAPLALALTLAVWMGYYVAGGATYALALVGMAWSPVVAAWWPT